MPKLKKGWYLAQVGLDGALSFSPILAFNSPICRAESPPGTPKPYQPFVILYCNIYARTPG